MQMGSWPIIGAPKHCEFFHQCLTFSFSLSLSLCRLCQCLQRLGSLASSSVFTFAQESDSVSLAFFTKIKGWQILTHLCFWKVEKLISCINPILKLSPRWNCTNLGIKCQRSQMFKLHTVMCLYYNQKML